MTSKLADIFTLTIDGTEVFFLVVLLVAVFLLMPLFKEMMAAFCLRYVLKIHLGDWLKLPEGAGEIKMQKLTHLGVRLQSGTLLWIPNSTIFQKTTHIQKKEEPFSFVLEFPIDFQSEESLKNLVESVYQEATLSSFRALSRDPQVKLIYEQHQLKLYCLCFACNEKCVAFYQQSMIYTVLEHFEKRNS